MVSSFSNAAEFSSKYKYQSLCSFRIVAGIKLGEEADIETIVEPILSNAKIFGVNLYEVGMADMVCAYFKELTAGVGAVRATLKKYVA